MNSAATTIAFLASGATLTVALAGIGTASAATPSVRSAAASTSSCLVTTIGSGSTGTLVRTWQARLNVPVTGTFDARTVTATKNWQSVRHLVVDGIVGPVTWASQGGFPGCSAPAVPAAQTTQYVAEDGSHAVRFHSAPSTSAPVTGYANAGDAVTGTVSGYWMRAAKGYINTSTMVQDTGWRAYNGTMPAHYLCNVPTYLNSSWSGAPGYTPATQRVLGCGEIAPLLAMNAAYKKAFGKNLAIDLTYRSYAEQLYWYKDRPTLAARPGTSNHGWGAAIDFWENDASPYRFGQPGQKWLQAHAAEYGFTSVGRPAVEYWHFNFQG